MCCYLIYPLKGRILKGDVIPNPGETISKAIITVRVTSVIMLSLLRTTISVLPLSSPSTNINVSNSNSRAVKNRV